MTFYLLAPSSHSIYTTIRRIPRIGTVIPAPKSSQVKSAPNSPRRVLNLIMNLTLSDCNAHSGLRHWWMMRKHWLPYFHVFMHVQNVPITHGELLWLGGNPFDHVTCVYSRICLHIYLDQCSSHSMMRHLRQNLALFSPSCQMSFLVWSQKTYASMYHRRAWTVQRNHVRPTPLYVSVI